MASTTRNIFTLGEYNDETLAGEGVPLPSVWAGDTRFVDGRAKLPSNMYFTGGNGYQPGYPSSLPEKTTYADKIDISTDTNSSVPSAQLPFTIGSTDDGFNTPSTTISWYAGHQRTRVYKLTYSTESQSSSPSGTFQNGPGGDNNWTQMAAVGNDTAGYFTGGDQQAAQSKTQKITFSAETFAFLPSSGNIPGNRTRQSSIGHETRGYFVGGFPSTNHASRMEYSTDTMTQIANAQEAYFSRGATGNDTHAYFAGGTSGPHNGFTGGENPAEKLTYATETFAASPTIYGSYNYNLPSYWGPGQRRGLAGSGDKQSGYFAGGLYPAPGTPGDMRSWVDKIDFATDTVQRRKTTLQNARAVGQMGTGARKNALATFDPPTPTPTDTTPRQEAKGGVPNFGYWGTGWYDNDTNKLNYANETVSSLGGLSKDLADAAVVSSDTTWYQAGGYSHPSSPARWSGTDKIVYATDTKTTNFLNMPSARNTPSSNHYGSKNMTGFSYPSGGKGYFSGGNDGWFGGRSITTKLTYSSETYSDMPSANVPHARADAFGRSSTTAGYRGGGADAPSPNNISNTSKLTFSNETWSLIPAAKLELGPGQPQRGASVGNIGDAYWMGSGDDNTSITNKFNYSTETISVGPNLTRGEGDWAGSGNVTNAFMSGGDHSSYMKYTYSTDTVSESPANMTFTTKNNTAGSAQDDTNGMVSVPYVV